MRLSSYHGWLLGALVLTLYFGGPSLAQDHTAKRFFYAGDGYLRLISEKNGKSFSGGFRNEDGYPDEKAYRHISAVFGVPNASHGKLISMRLIEFMDFLEDQLGGGEALITLTSGYRAPEYNTTLRKKGALAAKASLHQYGMAADFIMEGVPSKRVWEYVRSLGFGGTGFYHGRTVHVDVGPARFWDENSSGVGTGLSDDNKLVGLVTDFDIYGSGEPVILTFIRMTAFPIRLGTKFTLVSMQQASGDVLSSVVFTPAGVEGAHDECVQFSNIKQMASLRWSLPPTLMPGRYRVAATMCDSGRDQMPTRILTPEFQVRLP
jgi:uncharacterized protein YcbK (DUF882 family)